MRMLSFILLISFFAGDLSGLLTSHTCAGNVELPTWVWQDNSCSHHSGIQSHVHSESTNSCCGAMVEGPACCQSAEGQAVPCCTNEQTIELQDRDWVDARPDEYEYSWSGTPLQTAKLFGLKSLVVEQTIIRPYRPPDLIPTRQVRQAKLQRYNC